MQAATRSIHPEQPNEVVSTEILIIGFGFSVIPLLRELKRSGANYVIISNGEGSIWDRLEKHGRLDFDLVSSMHTSLYSFELVNRDPEDRYLTSKEYLAFIKKYLTEHRSEVRKDWVIAVENHPFHSIVRTRSGTVFATKHLVIATAFKRRMNQLLNDFDYASARHKTVAITAMGDSVNLMISKMIPYDNRIILITNGFFLLDKLSFYNGTSYTLDQLEYHNIRRISNLLYRKTITTGLDFVVICQMLFKFAGINHVYFKHPLAIRRFVQKINFKNLFPKSPVPNGIIAIKYWPIDSYQKLFDDDELKQSIKDGYLLNDIAFFLERGLVELWPKRETIIDREARTIRWKDNVVKYDQIADADYEVPNLPEIVVKRQGAPERKYEYAYRNTFMGLVPKELRNVYFIGFTRPTTGGLNNITEMQCLFAHKMITDTSFHREIYDDIAQRIRKYNKYYYLTDGQSATDHLVHYGFYTDDIARLIRITPRLLDCRSLKDVAIYFIFPNCAFKFRQSGPYKVEGVKEMIRQIYRNHRGFSVIIHYLLTYALLQLTAYTTVVMAYHRQELPLLAVPFLLLIVWLNPVTPFVAANGFGRNVYLNAILAMALGITAYYRTPWVPLASLLAVFVLTYVFHRFGWSRAPFNDLRNKQSPKYREFFRRYCAAFKEVFSERTSSIQRHFAGSPHSHAAESPHSHV
jgi:hypothetical protein